MQTSATILLFIKKRVARVLFSCDHARAGTGLPGQFQIPRKSGKNLRLKPAFPSTILAQYREMNAFFQMPCW